MDVMIWLIIFMVGVLAGTRLADYKWRSNASKVMYCESNGKLYKVLTKTRYDYLEMINKSHIAQTLSRK